MSLFVCAVGHITSTSYTAILINICLNTGSDAQLQNTRHCFAGEQDRLIQCYLIFSYGDVLWTHSTASAWTAKMNHHCTLINHSWHIAAGMGRNRLSHWHPPCHKGWTHRALMRYEQKLADFHFPSVCLVLQSFLPYKCTNLWNIRE